MRKYTGKKMLLLSIVFVLSLQLFSGSAFAEGDNLLENLSPGFEGAAVQWELQKNVTFENGATVTGATAHTGQKSVIFPGVFGDDGEKLKDSSVSFWVKVKPGTNYTLSFYMKNSMKNAISVSGLYYGDLATRVNKGDFQETWPYLTYDAYYGLYFYDVKAGGSKTPFMFGAIRDGAERDVWHKVEINFSTPYHAVRFLSFGITGLGEDPVVAVDDMCLRETKSPSGMQVTRAFGGDFEAIDGAAKVIKPTAIDVWDGDFGETAVIREENGNHFARISADGTKNGIILSSYSKPFIFRGTSLGTRYKISFRAKSEGKYPIELWFGDKESAHQYLGIFNKFLPASENGEWETYSVYLNLTTLLQSAPSITKALCVLFDKPQSGVVDIDDMYVGFDTAEIGFYKSLEFYEENGSRFLSAKDATLTQDAICTEKSIPARSLEDIETQNGYKTVKVRAHAFPAYNAEQQKYETKKAALGVSVYQIKDTVKTLVDFDFIKDESQDGKVLDTIGAVRIPETTDPAVYYTVEACLWDIETMQPLLKKATLE